MYRKNLNAIVGLGMFTFAFACGSNDQQSGSGSAAANDGGAPASGGSGDTGGNESGGSPEASGGNTPTGGADETGGKANGGASSTGGATATGVANATGGRSKNGGASSTGGATATGGANATGGRSKSGGASGGTTTTGGAGGSGDTSVTGGNKATGGVSSTGTSNASGYESWVWPYNANDGWPPQVKAIDDHAASFTHISPTLYTLNYSGAAYSSGLAHYVTCSDPCGCSDAGSNNFGKFSGLTGSSASLNNTTITTQSFTTWAHGRGLNVVPAIYGGAGNCGNDTSLEAILCNGSTTACTAQTNFVNAMVAELMSNGYDGYNFDWETTAVAGSYAKAFVAFVNAFKAALVSAGAPNALVTADALDNNMAGTYCSGNSGFIDLSLLRDSSIDRVILEDYYQPLGTATLTCPNKAATSSSPLTCDETMTGELALMCPPNLNYDKAVIGLEASSDGTNPFAGAALAAMKSYGFTKVAVWPQYPFMNTTGMTSADATATWYGLLQSFITP